jgi:hypothetical protein
MDIRNVTSLSLFKTNLRNSPLVRQACVAVPHVFVTDNEPVKGHHTAWFAGVIAQRDYSWNPYIGDLWNLHELRHVALARQGADPSVPWTQWMARMISDEFEASFLTEVLVYLQEPWLRDNTFDHEIWVDRILRDPTLGSRFLPGNIEHYARMLRYQVIAGGEPMDFISRQIRAYHATNNAWAVLWSQIVGVGPHKDKPAFRVVEDFLANNDVQNPKIVRKFLESVSDPEDPYAIPFPHQGRVFDQIYMKNVMNFGNHLCTV